MKESQPGTTQVELKDTSASAFSILLKYMYSGRLNLLEIKVKPYLSWNKQDYRIINLSINLYTLPQSGNIQVHVHECKLEIVFW